MAKKKLTKDQINQNILKKQYDAQVRRIQAGYRDISKRGGLFSVKVEDIIGDRYNPERYSKRDIANLKKISKESLYRMARTETGKSGYTILRQRRTEAGRKGAKAKREKREREKHPRLDTNYNFLHLTPEEFRNLQVTGNVEYYGKGLNRHASIVDVNLIDTSTGEIIESSDRGVTPVEVNGTIYQYDPQTNRFIPSGHIPKDAKERWYKEEYSPSEDIEIDTPYDFTDEVPEERTYGSDGYDDEDDEPNPYDDIYVDSEGVPHYESELQDYIDTKLDNIYDRMDDLDAYGEQLKDELDSALSEMNNADKARFLDEYGDDLESSLEAEARYLNDKDGDIRSNEKGFNHFHSKSLNIIWDGAVPLSSVSIFYN